MNHRRRITSPNPGAGTGLASRMLGVAALTLAIPMTAGAVSPVEVHPSLSASPLLASVQGIVMGATGMPVLPDALVEKVVQLLNDRYDAGLTFNPSGGGNVDALYTPENFSNHTYTDGMNDLLKALTTNYSPDDDVTVFGVSQSAGIIGMALQKMVDDPSLSVPNNMHFVALAPPTMPIHDNGAGLFLADKNSALYNWLYPDAQNPFPTDSPYPTDVYCGMYDPICDSPKALPWNFYTSQNLNNASHLIHGGYTKLTTAELEYEMNHATHLTDISHGSTNFYLMDDIHNFGTAANPDYEPFLPMLGWLTWLKPVYDLFLPYDTVQVNLGYHDALHTVTIDPFTLWGVDHAGVTDAIVTNSNFYELAHEAWQAGVAAFLQDLGWAG